MVLVGCGLYLYRVCPAVMLTPEAEMRAIARQVQAYLNGFAASELARLAIRLPAEDLTAKYLELGMQVEGR